MNVLRVALEGYSALIDIDPRHFSLFSDQDNVLIKEHSRGSASVANSAIQQITHSLGYYPHFYTYIEVSSGRYQIVNGHNLFGDGRSHVDTTKLYIRNTSGATAIVRYFIFYDDIPET